MVRETSINVYKEILASGMIEGLKRRVYQYVAESGEQNMTAGEVYHWHFKALGVSQNSTNPRMSELAQQLAFAEDEERTCRATGKTAIAYKIDLSANKVIPLPKKRTKDQIIKSLELKVAAQELLLKDLNSAFERWSFGDEELPYLPITKLRDLFTEKIQE